MTSALNRPVVRPLWLALTVSMLLLMPGTSPNASAQEAATVGVLRASEGAPSPELSEAIDGALLRDLAELAGIRDPVVSPVDYAEIQLSVGCTDDSRACLGAIAQAMHAGSLLVRSLRTDAQGATQLELRYFDGSSSDEPASVSSAVPSERAGELVTAVPGLVRELFGIPEVAPPAPSLEYDQAPSVEAPAHTEPAPEPARGGSFAPWITIGAGAAVLATGVVMGVMAEEDFRVWKGQAIRSEAQAERANEGLQQLQDRALAANVLMVAGSVVLAAGSVWLAFDLSDDDDAGGRASLALEPRLDGAALRYRETL